MHILEMLAGISKYLPDSPNVRVNRRRKASRTLGLLNSLCKDNGLLPQVYTMAGRG
jgi:hypothetical protein